MTTATCKLYVYCSLKANNCKTPLWVEYVGPYVCLHLYQTKQTNNTKLAQPLRKNPVGKSTNQQKVNPKQGAKAQIKA